MWKVVIADDEERICQLIKALVEWERIGLELVGTARNGLEAIELVSSVHPDILITDIRMPGCDGLELIGKVKESHSDLEIVIISGYAHFNYAQTAIKYGVGEYLLKPIDKAELNATLEKMCRHIEGRQQAEKREGTDWFSTGNDLMRLRKQLIADLLEQDNLALTEERLEQDYHLHVQQGKYQTFCIKLDYASAEVNVSTLEIVEEKINDILEANLRTVCQEMVWSMRESTVYGVVNYASSKKDDIRRLLRDCMNQLEVQRNLFAPITFSISLGCSVKTADEIEESLNESKIILKERLVEGTGHLLETMPIASALHEENLLEKYRRSIAHAMEVLSMEKAAEAVDGLHQEALKVKKVCGYEILELVLSAGDLFAIQLELKDRQTILEKYHRNCEQCSSIDMLFECLKGFQSSFIEALIEERDNDALRPIRQSKQYIQNHYHEQITLEEVSSAVGLSAGYFSALFKKETGEGFAKYLINVRIEQAKIMLRETNLQVTEICRRVGYNDQKHFVSTFEKSAGVKPGTYRKLYG